MTRHTSRLLLLATCLISTAIVLSSLPSASAEVLGIDLGSDVFKVVLVKAGGMDIALNEGSGRKTPTSVAFVNGERFVGAPAQDLAIRYPKNVVSSFNEVLGRRFNTSRDYWWGKHASQNMWTKNSIIDPNTHKMMYKVGEELIPFEEIMAHLLAYAGKIGSAELSFPVKDCVITVPAYWSHAQRVALLDAAQLAGLHVLSLINQPAAIALNYGLDRTFTADNSEIVVFVDVGYSDAQVSIFKFTGVLDKKNKTIGSASLLSQTWGSGLGGRSFDQAMVVQVWQHLQAKEVQTSDERIIPKLTKACRKAKEILTANKETTVYVESLTDTFDLEYKFTREWADTAFKDPAGQIATLVAQAIGLAKIEPEVITAVELVGGGSRIPKIQEEIAQAVGRPEIIGRHLNSDEAAAFGAALHAASLSASHRVREFRLKDAMLAHFPIAVSATPEGMEPIGQAKAELDIDDEEEATGEISPQVPIWKPLFQATSRYGAKKALTFHGTKNFTLGLEYFTTLGDTTPAEVAAGHIYGTFKSLGEYEVSGIPKQPEYNLTGIPRITARFTLTPNGTATITRVTANITVHAIRKEEVKEEEEPLHEEKPAETVETTPAAEETEASTPNEDTETATEDAGTTPAAEGEAESAEAEKVEVEERKPEVPKKEKKYIDVPYIKSQLVNLKVAPKKVVGFTAEDFAASKKRMREIDEKERIRKDTDKAKNNLESFLYDARDKLYEDNFIAHSTEEERETLTAELAVASEWLDDEGQASTKAEYAERLKKLTDIADKVTYRINQEPLRADAVAACLAYFNYTRVAAQNITKRLEVEETEKEALLTKVVDTEIWVNKTVDAQAEKKLNEDPVASAYEISRKCKDVYDQMSRLMKRKVRKPPKPAPKVVETNATEEATKTDESTSSEQTQESTPAEENQQQTEETPSETPAGEKDEL